MENPLQEAMETLVSKIIDLEEKSRNNQNFETLCLALLAHARVAFASLQFDEVENCSNQCIRIAKRKNLLIYQEAAKKEKEILLRHKLRIQDELAKKLSPEAQMKVLKDYIKEAIVSLRNEGLI